MASSQIQLSPQELLSQAQQMQSVCDEYNSIFESLKTTLSNVNEGFSAKLAHNFLAKITSAQKGFSKIVELLQGGVKAAHTAVDTFTSVDDQLAKLFQNGDFDLTQLGTGGFSDLAKNNPELYEFVKDLLPDEAQILISAFENNDWSSVVDTMFHGFTKEMKGKVEKIIKDQTGLNVDIKSTYEKIKKGDYADALFDIAGATNDSIMKKGGITMEGAAIDFLLRTSRMSTDPNSFTNKEASVYTDKMIDAFQNKNYTEVLNQFSTYVGDTSVRTLFTAAGDTASNVLDIATKGTIGISVSEINDKLEGIIGYNPGKTVHTIGSKLGDAWHAVANGDKEGAGKCLSAAAKTGKDFVKGVTGKVSKMFK